MGFRAAGPPPAPHAPARGVNKTEPVAGSATPRQRHPVARGRSAARCRGGAGRGRAVRCHAASFVIVIAPERTSSICARGGLTSSCASASAGGEREMLLRRSQRVAGCCWCSPFCRRPRTESLRLFRKAGRTCCRGKQPLGLCGSPDQRTRLLQEALNAAVIHRDHQWRGLQGKCGLSAPDQRGAIAQRPPPAYICEGHGLPSAALESTPAG